LGDASYQQIEGAHQALNALANNRLGIAHVLSDRLGRRRHEKRACHQHPANH
jgi:hypothetical protein